MNKTRIIRAGSPGFRLLPRASLGINLLFTVLMLLVAIAVLPKAAVLAVGAGMSVGMIIDAQLLFSDAQALVATAVSTNVIDLGTDRNIGIGEPMAVVITVDVALDRTTGDETYSVQLQTDDNVGFASPANVGGAYALTTYVAGTKFVIPLPSGIETERFLRLNYTLGGTTPLGTLTAFLQPLAMASVGENVYYPDAINVG